MKKTIKIIALILALVLALSAFVSCGKKKASDEDDTAKETAEKQTETDKAEADENKADPYAWLGLEDMPKCNYLDTVATNHYVETYDYYTFSIVTEQTEAVDGINTYSNTGANKQYSVDGKVYSINDNNKLYMEYDMTSTAEAAKDRLENAMSSGTNIKGREFNTAGREAIPLYSDKGDTAEYEYYEYVTASSPESTVSRLTERFYMKDGDVYAIYQLSQLGEIKTESTKVIKSISGDIPEDMFKIPDLTGYEKYN